MSSDTNLQTTTTTSGFACLGLILACLTQSRRWRDQSRKTGVVSPSFRVLARSLFSWSRTRLVCGELEYGRAPRPVCRHYPLCVAVTCGGRALERFSSKHEPKVAKINHKEAKWKKCQQVEKSCLRGNGPHEPNHHILGLEDDGSGTIISMSSSSSSSHKK